MLKHRKFFSLLLIFTILPNGFRLIPLKQCLNTSDLDMRACGQDGDDKLRCITASQICDGVTDCPSGTDESDCNDNLPTLEEYEATQYLYCNDDQYTCDDGSCIMMSKLCNGKPDCRSGEDEGFSCGRCELYECSHKCQDTPKGPQCLCPSNMHLSIDDKTCEFQDHCAIDRNKCSQHCTQHHDLVSCFCAEGYTLNANGVDCDVSEAHRNGAILFVCAEKEICRMDLFNDSMSTNSLTTTQNKVLAIAYNQDADAVYFATNEGHHSAKIYSETELESKWLYTGFGIRRIAFDWITGNVYYAADGLGIGVCSLDGRYCSHLIVGHKPVELNHIQTYGDLLVHPKRGILMWVDYNSEHPNGAIMASGLDGRKSRIISGHTSERIRHIAMDYVRDSLYLLDGDTLWKLDLNTLERHPVVFHTLPYQFLVFDNKLLFVSRINKKMVKQHLANSHEYNESMNALDGDEFPIAINNTLYYEKFVDPCLSAGCSHMCVLKEAIHDHMPAARCICPDKYSVSDFTGECVPNRQINGPVRTSSSHMADMCVRNEACFNGGVCKNTYIASDLETPACECLHGFGGLYCEIPVLYKLESSASWLTVFFLMIIFISIGAGVVFFILFLRSNHHLTRKFERFSNNCMSPNVECLRNSIGSRGSNRRSPGQFSASPTLLLDNLEGDTLNPAANKPIVEIGEPFFDPTFSASNI